MNKYTTIFITIITAALYALGLTFYQGYLGELGIEESLFPMAVDRTLFHGLIATTKMSFKAILWFLLAAEGVVLVAAISSFIFKIARKLISPKIQLTPAASVATLGVEDNDNFLTFSYKVFAIAVATLLVYVGVLLILMAAGRAGKETAISFKENIESENGRRVSIIFKDDRPPMQASPVICNQYQCSYYGEVGSFIVNLSEIKAIQSCITK
jgi:hypothetical protein